jgi:hypothetical protein
MLSFHLRLGLLQASQSFMFKLTDPEKTYMPTSLYSQLPVPSPQGEQPLVTYYKYIYPKINQHPSFTEHPRFFSKVFHTVRLIRQNGVSKSFRTESITKRTTTINTRWEATLSKTITYCSMQCSNSIVDKLCEEYVYISNKRIRLSIATRPLLGPTQRDIQWVPGASSPGLKQSKREAHHSLPPTSQVKNAWNLTSASPYIFITSLSTRTT